MLRFACLKHSGISRLGQERIREALAEVARLLSWRNENFRGVNNHPAANCRFCCRRNTPLEILSGYTPRKTNHAQQGKPARLHNRVAEFTVPFLEGVICALQTRGGTRSEGNRPTPGPRSSGFNNRTRSLPRTRSQCSGHATPPNTAAEAPLLELIKGKLVELGATTQENILCSIQGSHQIIHKSLAGRDLRICQGRHKHSPVPFCPTSSHQLARAFHT